MAAPEAPPRLDAINWMQVIPVLRVTRSFRMAFSLTKLSFATAGIVLLWLWGRLLDAVWGSHDPFILFEQGLLANGFGFALSLVTLNVNAALGHLGGLRSSVTALWSNYPLFASLYSLVAMFIAALMWGTVARLAAVEAARDERLSWSEAFSFARRKIAVFVAAPLLPVFVAGGLLLTMLVGSLLCWLLSWLWIGYPVFGLLTGLAVALGLVASLAFLMILLALPLVYPTVAVEAVDMFDSVTRPFTYLWQRPWMAAGCLLVAVIHGTICFLVLYSVVFVGVRLTQSVSSTGFHGREGTDAFWPAPTYGDLVPEVPSAPPALLVDGAIPGDVAAELDRIRAGTPAAAPDASAAPLAAQARTALDILAASGQLPTAYWEELSAAQTLAYLLVRFWLSLLSAMLAGFVVCYALCAATQTYYLLRREVDGIDLDDVYMEDYEQEEPVAPAAQAPAPAPLASGVQLTLPGAGVAAAASQPASVSANAAASPAQAGADTGAAGESSGSAGASPAS